LELNNNDIINGNFRKLDLIWEKIVLFIMVELNSTRIPSMLYRVLSIIAYIFLITSFNTVTARANEDIKFETIFFESFLFQQKEYSSYAIRNSAEFNCLLKKIPDISPSSIPYINFDKEILIAVFQGLKPTGGYDIRIEKVIMSNDQLYVYLKEKKPDRNAIVTCAFTSPYHIIKIQKTNKPIIFISEEMPPTPKRKSR